MNDQQNHREVPMRIRVKFAKLASIRFISHLDLFRAWERTIRRAKLPIQYSLGFNPRPKINLALPLPLGFTSKAEIMDLIFEKHVPVINTEKKLINALPPGLQVLKISEIQIDAPKLQKKIIAAEYITTLNTSITEKKIQSLLRENQIFRERRGKTYDLRPLILDLSTLPQNNKSRNQLYMKLSARDGATGRPDEVLNALDIDPLSARIHRTSLIFKD
jgi:radical SAM-linked protein